MTPEQKKLLEPFADQLRQWEIKMAGLEPATTTNCWYWIYQAARLLKMAISTRRVESKECGL